MSISQALTLLDGLPCSRSVQLLSFLSLCKHIAHMRWYRSERNSPGGQGEFSLLVTQGCDTDGQADRRGGACSTWGAPWVCGQLCSALSHSMVGRERSHRGLHSPCPSGAGCSMPGEGWGTGLARLGSVFNPPWGLSSRTLLLVKPPGHRPPSQQTLSSRPPWVCGLTAFPGTASPGQLALLSGKPCKETVMGTSRALCQGSF